MFERILTTTVNDIEHTESQSLNGISVVKIFFQPGVQVSAAVAQLTAASQPAIRQMPPGITPPLVISYSASSVPILQLALSGQGLSEQQLNDFGTNFIRQSLATVPGAAVPWPYGGKQRQIMIDLQPAAMQAEGAVAQRCCKRRQPHRTLFFRQAHRRSASSNTMSISTRGRRPSRN